MKSPHRASSRATWRRLDHHRGAAGAGRRADAGSDPRPCRTGRLPDAVAVEPDAGGARSRDRGTPADAVSRRGQISRSFWSRTKSALASCRRRRSAAVFATRRDVSIRSSPPRAQCRVHRRRTSALAQASSPSGELICPAFPSPCSPVSSAPARPRCCARC